MVVEREPAKTPLSPTKPNQQAPQPSVIKVPQQPEFGKASPLRSRDEASVFNIPKPHHARPEHHRPVQPGQAAQQQQHYIFDPLNRNAVRPEQPVQRPYPAAHFENDVTEIPKPAYYPAWTIPPAAPPPMFSSRMGSGGFTAVNSSESPANMIDLTTTTELALLDAGIGAVDPYDYIDAGKANENIKALLEGAFDDEDEKPKTRSRKKKIEAAVEKLSDKLQNLEVKSEQKKEEESSFVDEEEDEREVDDGTVEGLSVKLLPHQVDGVEWMREKEIGTKKKNGVLPKGGILADDVIYRVFLVCTWFLTVNRWV